MTAPPPASDAAAHYRGVVAELYDVFVPVRGPQRDLAFFRRAVEAGAKASVDAPEAPALELGCGTGRLLVPLRQAGLAVEGTDPAPEMLAHLRGYAAAAQVDVVAHTQAMEDLDLARRYHTIFAALGTFQLLVEPAVVARALERIRAHLVPGGQLLLALMTPWAEIARPEDTAWHVRRTAVRPRDGATVVLSEAVQTDRAAQLQVRLSRYEIVVEGKVVETHIAPLTVRWYGDGEIRLLLERHGFAQVRTRQGYDDGGTDLIVWART